MPFSFRVILEPGVRAVEVEELDTEVNRDAEFKAALFEEDKLEVPVEEAVTCPVATKEGTFNEAVLAASISTESTLNDEDEEARFKGEAEVVGNTFVEATACVRLVLSFL